MSKQRRKKTTRKATHQSSRGRFNPAIWLTRHLQVALSSLGHLCRAPIPTLMTSAVIGIALALPMVMHLLVSNLQNLSGSWNGATSISLFLQQTVEQDQMEALARRIRDMPGIAVVKEINRNEALDQFKQLSGFSEALTALDENPLPNVLVVIPNETHSDPVFAERLVATLDKLPETEITQLDLQWVKRFYGITEIIQRGVLVLASLLGLAVLLIIGNTIRLEIQNRHDNIEITKLIGATNAFIRRPFLYSGIWYGILGGLIAWLLITVTLLMLSPPVTQLAGLYNSDFALKGLTLAELLVLLSGSTLLGLFGSWIAVARHLSKIEPD